MTIAIALRRASKSFAIGAARGGDHEKARDQITRSDSLQDACVADGRHVEMREAIEKKSDCENRQAANRDVARQFYASGAAFSRERRKTWSSKRQQ